MSQGNGANPTATALLAQTVDLLRGERADEAVQGLAQLAVARRMRDRRAGERGDGAQRCPAQLANPGADRIYNHPFRSS